MEKALLEDNVEVLKKAVGRWMDHRLVLMAASQFTAKKRLIDGGEFIKTADAVKKSVSLFSPLRTIYFPMTGLILSGENPPAEEIKRIHTNYEQLRSAGFRSTLFTYITAFLMEHHGTPAPERIKAIYDEMKKYHRFLTSYEDYPSAAIIAKQDGQIEDLVKISEQYYNALNDHGFYKGNDLQFLANMLVMHGEYSNELLDHVLQTRDELKRSGLKVKQMHYAALGVIALSGKIKDAAAYALDLSELKVFKWYKDMAIIAASVFVSQEYIDDAPAGLSAAIQAMIQAQQAAMAGGVAAAAAASSSSSS